MIGSDTLIVKRNGKHSLHICSITIALGMQFMYKEVAETGETPFQLIKKTEATWGKPDVEFISESVLQEVLISHQCADKSEPFYSDYAGDGIFLLDLDEQILYVRGGERGKEVLTPYISRCKRK